MDSDLEHWLVFFNGESLPLASPPNLADNFRVLAVDGGLSSVQGLGLQADVFIGDGDSCSASELPENSLILAQEKDVLDGEVALEFLQSKNPLKVDLYNFLQGRWDMSICHIQSLLRFMKLANRTHIHTPRSEIIYRNSPFKGPTKNGQLFSIIPLKPMEAVTIRGAKYEISQKDLKPGSGLGLSNQTTSTELSIDFAGHTPYLVEFHLSGAL